MNGKVSCKVSPSPARLSRWARSGLVDSARLYPIEYGQSDAFLVMERFL